MSELSDINRGDRIMARAILMSIRSNDVEQLSQLLNHDEFWKGRSYDDFVSMLSDEKNLEVIDALGTKSPLEDALFSGNYEGAELLAKAFPEMLRPDGHEQDAHYHQHSFLKYAIETGDIEPLLFAVKHGNPSGFVYPSVGVKAMYENFDVKDKLVDSLFELGLDASEMLRVFCSEVDPYRRDLSIWQINKCVAHGGDFSLNNYYTVLALATVPETKYFEVLLDCEFDINQNNGALLKESIKTFSSELFDTLIDAGANPALLDKPVIDYVDEPSSLFEHQKEAIAAMQDVLDRSNLKSEHENRAPAP